MLIIGSIASQGEYFTIVVLPDTQYYNSYFEETFQEQAIWACDCSPQDKLNILFVSHLGDIVHRGNSFIRDWRNAGSGFENLRKCGIQHGFLPGNHDINRHEDKPYHMFDEFFPVELYRDAWNGTRDQTLHNNYQLFTDPTTKTDYVFIHLEYYQWLDDKESVMNWANHVLKTHQDRFALLSTHYAGDSCSGGIQKHIKHLMHENCNLKFVFGGHVIGCGSEKTHSTINKCNETSYVFVSNYQTRSKGGSGWLRYYTFYNDKQKVCANTYSPYLQRFELDNNSHFSINLKNMKVGEGCANSRECKTKFIPPGFALGYVWILSINVIFFHLVFLIFIL